MFLLEAEVVVCGWKWWDAGLNVLFKQHGGDSCKVDCLVWQSCALVSWWLQVSNQHHSLLFSVCLPHWMLCRVWLCLRLFCHFFQLLKTCHLNWFQPIWKLVLVSSCCDTHSAYLFLAYCVMSALGSLLIPFVMQALFVSEQFLPLPRVFSCSIALTSWSIWFVFTLSVVMLSVFLSSPCLFQVFLFLPSVVLLTHKYLEEYESCMSPVLVQSCDESFCQIAPIYISSRFSLLSGPPVFLSLWSPVLFSFSGWHIFAAIINEYILSVCLFSCLDNA